MKETVSNISSMFYSAKAFAIFLVVAAHMSFTEVYHTAAIIRTSLGQIGVIIFFYISGFFYSRQKGDSKRFWLKKSKNLFIPWIVFAFASFALSAVLYKRIDNIPFNFLKHFFGVGTVYWYMTTLVILLVVFKFLYNKEWALYVCMVVSLVSIALSAIGIIVYNAYFNQYLNIFNWLGFFALGVYFRKYNLLEKIIGLKYFFISLIGTIISVVVVVFRGVQIEAYVDITSLLVEMFGLVLVLNLSYLLLKSKLLCDIGKKSFFIYLMHIQVVGLINARLPFNVVFFILRPFIGLMVCYIIACGTKLVLSKIKLDKYNFVFGLDR